MPTNRRQRRRGRPLHGSISPEALAAFAWWKAAETREQEREANNALHVAMKLKPWDFPAVIAPDTETPGWDATAQKERYRLLDELSEA